MLETSDINDKDILNSTKQERNAQGHVRFKYTVPSGRTITSEWMSREQLSSQVLILWCETIRQQMVADSQAEQEEMLAKARRARMDRQEQQDLEQGSKLLPGLVKSDASPALPEPASAVYVPTPATVSPGPSDPYQFVLHQLSEAERQLNELSAQQLVLKTQVEQWRALADTMRPAAKPSGTIVFPDKRG